MLRLPGSTRRSAGAGRGVCEGRDAVEVEPPNVRIRRTGAAMTRAVLSLVGLPIGVAIGWVLSRVPAAALVQSIVAGLVAAVLSTVGAAFIWARLSLDKHVVGAVSVDLFGVLLVLVIVGIASAVFHFALGWFKLVMHSSLGDTRPVVVGGVSGFVCALIFAVAAHAVDAQG